MVSFIFRVNQVRFIGHGDWQYKIFSGSFHIYSLRKHRNIIILNIVLYQPKPGCLKSKFIAQKLPLKREEIWSIFKRLYISHYLRELSMFNLALAGKLRAGLSQLNYHYVFLL